MARAVSRRTGTPPCSAMTGSSACMAWRSCGRLVRAKARNVADSSSNSVLWVERHRADQRGVLPSGRSQRQDGLVAHGHHLAVSTMARAVSRRAGTTPCSAMTGSSACTALRSCNRLVRAKVRNVAVSSSNSGLWVERHTADQRAARLANTASLYKNAMNVKNLNT